MENPFFVKHYMSSICKSKSIDISSDSFMLDKTTRWNGCILYCNGNIFLGELIFFLWDQMLWMVEWQNSHLMHLSNENKKRFANKSGFIWWISEGNVKIWKQKSWTGFRKYLQNIYLDCLRFFCFSNLYEFFFYRDHYKKCEEYNSTWCEAQLKKN